MENFIKLIKEKDKKIDDSYINRELNVFEEVLEKLEEEHKLLIKNQTEVEHLLELIEKHELETSKPYEYIEDEWGIKEWLSNVTYILEKLHLLPTNELTEKDLEYLKAEKSKLLFEKSRLESEHKRLHKLIIETKLSLNDVRENVCKELTKGYSIAAVAEKMLVDFKAKTENEYYYDTGRKKIIQYLESLFDLNKVSSKIVFQVLEKSKVIEYVYNIKDEPNYHSGFNYNSNYYFAPFKGTWHLKA